MAQIKRIDRIWSGVFNEGDRPQVDRNIVEVLKHVPIFENLSGREADNIARIAYRRRYDEGEVVIHQGQDSAGMYIIMDGEHYLESVHMYAGCDPYPTKKQGKKEVPIVNPGQYPYVMKFPNNVTEFSNMDTPIDVSECDGEVYVIMHATTCDLICDVLPGAAGEPDEEVVIAEPEVTRLVKGKIGNKRLRAFNNKNLDIGLSVKAYPNPVSNYLNLEFEGVRDDNVIIQLFDVLGRVIIEEKISVIDGAQMQLKLPDFVTDGVHYLRIKDQATIRSIPIIVTKSRYTGKY